MVMEVRNLRFGTNAEQNVEVGTISTCCIFIKKTLGRKWKWITSKYLEFSRPPIKTSDIQLTIRRILRHGGSYPSTHSPPIRSLHPLRFLFRALLPDFFPSLIRHNSALLNPPPKPLPTNPGPGAGEYLLQESLTSFRIRSTPSLRKR